MANHVSVGGNTAATESVELYPNLSAAKKETRAFDIYLKKHGGHVLYACYTCDLSPGRLHT